MIVGHGDLASVMPKKSDLLFFASGVSNSQETRESEYQREIDLLLTQNKTLHIVYFSSLAIFYSNTRYARHKRYMESLIKKWFPLYTIIRLGNITFGKNPHTLINYLKTHPEAEIRDEYRYVCSKNELLHWINLIPKWSCEITITGERLKVKEIKEKYVKES